MSKSLMCIADKYILHTPIGKGAYKKDGDRTLVRQGIVAKRSFIEDRNSFDNNELYVIDEEATEEFYKQREINIKENQARKERENVSFADMVEGMAKVASGVKSEPKKEVKETSKKAEKKAEPEEEKSIEDMNVSELKAYCDDNGIEYHHKAGKSKLIELIKEQND